MLTTSHPWLDPDSPFTRRHRPKSQSVLRTNLGACSPAELFVPEGDAQSSAQGREDALRVPLHHPQTGEAGRQDGRQARRSAAAARRVGQQGRPTCRSSESTTMTSCPACRITSMSRSSSRYPVSSSDEAACTRQGQHDQGGWRGRGARPVVVMVVVALTQLVGPGHEHLQRVPDQQHVPRLHAQPKTASQHQSTSRAASVQWPTDLCDEREVEVDDLLGHVLEVEHRLVLGERLHDDLLHHLRPVTRLRPKQLLHVRPLLLQVRALCEVVGIQGLVDSLRASTRRSAAGDELLPHPEGCSTQVSEDIPRSLVWIRRSTSWPY